MAAATPPTASWSAVHACGSVSSSDGAFGWMAQMGLAQSGWKPSDSTGTTHGANEQQQQQQLLQKLLRQVLKEIKGHSHSWPFAEPVVSQPTLHMASHRLVHAAPSIGPGLCDAPCAEMRWPQNTDEVSDYLTIIKDPIDLQVLVPNVMNHRYAIPSARWCFCRCRCCSPQFGALEAPEACNCTPVTLSVAAASERRWNVALGEC